MIEKEYWKTIDDYPDYIISNYGRVKSKRKTKKTFKFLKPSLNNGYTRVTLVNSNGEKHFATHRLVAFYFCEGYCDLLIVNHKDGNRSNNHFENLEWVTQKENIQHSINSGFTCKNSKKSYANQKLNIYQVLAIKTWANAGKNPKIISKDFNIKYSTIMKIAQGKLWKNILPEVKGKYTTGANQGTYVD
jgi:hypothetical protein